jgi:SAM-dependent methyltransferase
MSILKTPSDIMDLANAFRASRVLLTAFELDLFTALEGSSKTSDEVSKSIGTSPRATDRLMNALVSLGLLEKKNGKFSNTPAASKFLVVGKPGYMGGLAHTVNLWDTWSTMTEAVKTGTSVLRRGTVNERGDKWLESFITAMHLRAKLQAPAIASMLDLSGVNRILDVGGGSGVFSFAFIDAKAGLKATVFDLSNVTALTNKYIKEEGYSGKVETVSGDYLTDELGTDYNLVFLSAIIHSNSPEENKFLFRKCGSALNSGGQLVVVDFMMDEDRTNPPMGALFALNMLVGTEAGDTYTESEVQSWMEEAGFSDIKRSDTEFGTSLIVGKKK